MDCGAGSQPPDRCRVRFDASRNASLGNWNAFRGDRVGRGGNSGLFCSRGYGGRPALGWREDARRGIAFSRWGEASMTEPLSQFRPDLVHEGFDVLWQRGFSFPLVKLIETALLTLENMAMNAVGCSLRIGRLQRCDQIQMIPVDLLQNGDVVTSPAGRENADQQPDSSQSFEASLVPRK